MATVMKVGRSYLIKTPCGYDDQGKPLIKTKIWSPDQPWKQNKTEGEYYEHVDQSDKKCDYVSAASSTRFQVFAEQWFKDYAELNHKDTTLQRERNLCKRTYKAIGDLSIDRISVREIQTFINDLARYGTNLVNGKPLAYKTVKHHLSFVSSVFEYALRLDIIKDNPCKRVFVPKNIENRVSRSREKQIYTKEQAREFLKILSGAPIMFRVYYTLCIFTGCRRAELLGLEWKDFDYKQQTVHIVRTSNYSKRKGIYTDTPKTEKSNRIIALPPEVLELVKEFKAERDEYIRKLGEMWNDTDRIFTSEDGHPMHVNTPYGWLKKLCDNNNFPFYGIHSFRHFFASAEIEAGIDPVTVAAMLGHSTPQTTLTIYAHYFQDARIKARNTMVDVLGITDSKRLYEHTRKEKKILSIINQLNDQGQDAAIAMLSGLVSEGIYK